MDPSNINDRIRQYRKAPKAERVSQREFAKELGLPESTLSRRLRRMDKEEKEGSSKMQAAHFSKPEPASQTRPSAAAVFSQPESTRQQVQIRYETRTKEVVDGVDLRALINAKTGGACSKEEVDKIYSNVMWMAALNPDKNIRVIVESLFNEANALALDICSSLGQVTKEKGFKSPLDYTKRALDYYDRARKKESDPEKIFQVVDAYERLLELYDKMSVEQQGALPKSFEAALLHPFEKSTFDAVINWQLEKATAKIRSGRA